MECRTCGRVLPTDAGARQHHAKVHGESLPNRTCKGCEVGFYDPKSQRAFCDDCEPNAGSNNPNWRDAQETAECRLCGAEFGYYPSDKEGAYCPACVDSSEEFLGEPYRKDAEWVDTACEYCHREMEVLQSTLDYGHGRFCSRDCLAGWLSENVVGENHHQWEGGAIPYGRRWWRIRREALERDDHRCRNCGRTDRELGREPDVHHIVPVRSFDSPEEAHTLDNVVCLCRSCHRSVEEGSVRVPDGPMD